MAQVIHVLDRFPAQLSNHESLRDVVVVLEAHHTNVIILEWNESLLLKEHLLQPTKTGITVSLITIGTINLECAKDSSGYESSIIDRP